MNFIEAEQIAEKLKKSKRWVYNHAQQLGGKKYILRHKSVNTTERYIQNINSDLLTLMNLLSEKVPQEGTPKEAEK